MPWTWVRPADPTLLDARPLLDVGTGDGQTLAALAVPGGLVVGVDESLDALRAARDTAPGLLTAASAAALPFSNSTFPGVLAADLFHHFADEELDAVLTELARVLRPDGRIVAWWYESPGRGGVGDPRFPRPYDAVAARARKHSLRTEKIELEVVAGSPATVGAAIYSS